MDEKASIESQNQEVAVHSSNFAISDIYKDRDEDINGFKNKKCLEDSDDGNDSNKENCPLNEEDIRPRKKIVLNRKHTVLPLSTISTSEVSGGKK